MASSFNHQILVDKLVKLNHSQASIETLSHWCIFHMSKAKQVVETWDKQFHCSPRERRLAFLYLANDILQNSRRKGSEFVGEFWKVLPDALSDVINNGDEVGQNAARRLIGIWEERKVFGSRGQILKDDLVGKHSNNNRNVKHFGFKLKQPSGSTLDKIISGYQAVHGGQLDEDFIINKCKNAISYLEKAEKEVGGNLNTGQFHGAAFVEELRGQHSILRDSIEQLTTIESSRATLVSHLREALLEQESKLEQVRRQLQAAQSQSEHPSNVCQQLLHSNNVRLPVDRSSMEVNTSAAPLSFIPADREQSAPARYMRHASFPEKTGDIEEDPRKSAAAAVAAKLTASTSSAQMLSYVLSSLASEGVGGGNPIKESSGEYPSEKTAKLDKDQPYIPMENPLQQPLHAFQHPESFQLATTSQQITSNDPPPPPSSTPPPLPLPPMAPYSISHYMQNAGSIDAAPQGYSMSQQQPPSFLSYPGLGAQMTGIASFTMPPANPYQGSDGSLYTQPSSMPMAPISRQQN